MDKVRVYYDREGNTLSVWFDDPKKEHICEEADDDVVLVKDRRGRVIGFERLNYLSRNAMQRSRWKCRWSEQGRAVESRRTVTSTDCRNYSSSVALGVWAIDGNHGPINCS